MKALQICSYKLSPKWNWTANHLSCLVFALVFVIALQTEAQNSFRLYLYQEPKNLSPQRLKETNSNFLTLNLYRNLYRLNSMGQIELELAAKPCRWSTPKTLECELKKNLTWSDLSPLTTADFIRSYRELLSKQNNFPRPDRLFKVKNAENFYHGKTTWENVGIKALSPLKIRFELDSVFPDFELFMADIILSPSKDTAFSGPYQLQEWQKGKHIRLANNPQYWHQLQRPPVEFYFVGDESAALRLYQNQKIDLLRRLPTALIAKYKTSPEFLWLPMWRFDYIGISPQYPLEVRRALTESLNFLELKKLYQSEGTPGCPGIPTEWLSQPPPCLSPQSQNQKVTLAKIPRFIYSDQGGEDHRRTAEWLQFQWQQKLQLQVSVKGLENKVFLSELENGKAELFRKGIALDRPTCLAALEKFTTGHQENYLIWSNNSYDTLVANLSQTNQEAEKKKLCSQALQVLMDAKILIPTGPIHFAALLRPQWKGLTWTPFFQLDLKELQQSKQ